MINSTQITKLADLKFADREPGSVSEAEYQAARAEIVDALEHGVAAGTIENAIITAPELPVQEAVAVQLEIERELETERELAAELPAAAWLVEVDVVEPGADAALVKVPKTVIVQSYDGTARGAEHFAADVYDWAEVYVRSVRPVYGQLVEARSEGRLDEVSR